MTGTARRVSAPARAGAAVSGVGATARVPLAFLRRDMLVERSYRAGLVLRIGGAIISVAVFYFLGRGLGVLGASSATSSPGGYFAFALVGIALNEYLNQGIGGLGSAVRESQTTGTLELVLVSPVRLPVVLLSLTLWPHVAATMTVAIYLAVGLAVGLPLVLTPATVAVSLLTLALTLASVSGLGLLAASAVILVRRGNPVGWAIRGAALVLSGVLYPTSVLPGALQAAGQLVPLTHSLTIMRGTLLGGLPIAQLGTELVVLAVLTAISLVAGVGACMAAVRIGRAEGFLGQY